MPRKPWRSVSVPTVGSLRNSRRRLNHRIGSTERVLNLMRGGARLTLHFKNGEAHWLLTIGGGVEASTAADVIKHPSVHASGDCLFKNGASQTYFIGN